MNRSPRVLVVEDEHDIAGLIKHALERSGDGQVDIVASGDEALRAITEQPPDVIILDLNLPVAQRDRGLPDRSGAGRPRPTSRSSC